MFRKNVFSNVLCLLVAVCVATSAVASEIKLPKAGAMVKLSEAYTGAHIRGVNFDPSNPFNLEFIIDQGTDNQVSIKEREKLVRYFLAALTIPEDKLWVNLSPYESDRILDDVTAKTEVGEVLLEQDYLLKQLSASLTYPDTKIGKQYWAQSTQDDLSKIWITPEKVSIYDNDSTVFITDVELKVESEAKVQSVLIPEIKNDVNNGRNFSPLRQMMHSMILGQWFKRKFAKSLYSFYFDSGKVAGIDMADASIKQKVFELYVEAFNKGVYNTTKKTRNPVTHRLEKRKYFSGGISAAVDRQKINKVTASTLIAKMGTQKFLTQRVDSLFVDKQGNDIPLKTNNQSSTSSAMSILDMMTKTDAISLTLGDVYELVTKASALSTTYADREAKLYFGNVIRDGFAVLNAGEDTHKVRDALQKLQRTLRSLVILDPVKEEVKVLSSSSIEEYGEKFSSARSKNATVGVLGVVSTVFLLYVLGKSGLLVVPAFIGIVFAILFALSKSSPMIAFEDDEQRAENLVLFKRILNETSDENRFALAASLALRQELMTKSEVKSYLFNRLLSQHSDEFNEMATDVKNKKDEELGLLFWDSHVKGELKKKYIEAILDSQIIDYSFLLKEDKNSTASSSLNEEEIYLQTVVALEQSIQSMDNLPYEIKVLSSALTEDFKKILVDKSMKIDARSQVRKKLKQLISFLIGTVAMGILLANIETSIPTSGAVTWSLGLGLLFVGRFVQKAGKLLSSHNALSKEAGKIINNTLNNSESKDDFVLAALIGLDNNLIDVKTVKKSLYKKSYENPTDPEIINSLEYKIYKEIDSIDFSDKQSVARFFFKYLSEDITLELEELTAEEAILTLGKIKLEKAEENLAKSKVGLAKSKENLAKAKARLDSVEALKGSLMMQNQDKADGLGVIQRQVDNLKVEFNGSLRDRFFTFIKAFPLDVVTPEILPAIEVLIQEKKAKDINVASHMLLDALSKMMTELSTVDREDEQAVSVIFEKLENTVTLVEQMENTYSETTMQSSALMTEIIKLVEWMNSIDPYDIGSESIAEIEAIVDGLLKTKEDSIEADALVAFVELMKEISTLGAEEDVEPIAAKAMDIFAGFATMKSMPEEFRVLSSALVEDLENMVSAEGRYSRSKRRRASYKRELILGLVGALSFGLVGMALLILKEKVPLLLYGSGGLLLTYGLYYNGKIRRDHFDTNYKKFSQLLRERLNNPESKDHFILAAIMAYNNEEFTPHGIQSILLKVSNSRRSDGNNFVHGLAEKLVAELEGVEQKDKKLELSFWYEQLSANAKFLIDEIKGRDSKTLTMLKNQTTKELTQKGRKVLESVQSSSAVKHGGIDLSGMLDGVEVSEAGADIQISSALVKNVSGITFKLVGQGEVLPLSQIIQVPMVAK